MEGEATTFFLNILETCKFNETIKNKFDKSKITLLLSPEVIKNEESVQLLKMQNQIELGTHMHLEFLKYSKHEVLETSEVQAEISPRGCLLFGAFNRIIHRSIWI